MAEVFNLNVEKTIKKIPRDNVQHIVTISLLENDTILVHTSMENDCDTADLILDALAIYADDVVELKLEDD